MAQLNLTFDLGSRTITSANLDGREVEVSAVASLLLMRGAAKLANDQGCNLLADDEEPTKASLDIARTFGCGGETTTGEGSGS